MNQNPRQPSMYAANRDRCGWSDSVIAVLSDLPGKGFWWRWLPRPPSPGGGKFCTRSTIATATARSDGPVASRAAQRAIPGLISGFFTARFSSLIQCVEANPPMARSFGSTLHTRTAPSAIVTCTSTVSVLLETAGANSAQIWLMYAAAPTGPTIGVRVRLIGESGRFQATPTTTIRMTSALITTSPSRDSSNRCCSVESCPPRRRRLRFSSSRPSRSVTTQPVIPGRKIPQTITQGPHRLRPRMHLGNDRE